MIPSWPELCTEAPNHCLDLSSIMLPETLLFPGNEIAVKKINSIEKKKLVKLHYVDFFRFGIAFALPCIAMQQ